MRVGLKYRVKDQIRDTLTFSDVGGRLTIKGYSRGEIKAGGKHDVTHKKIRNESNSTWRQLSTVSNPAEKERKVRNVFWV